MDGILFGVTANKTAQSTEKVSVNMNIATLAQIDMLIDQGYYSNRSDFINQAVRQILDQKQPLVERVIAQEKATEKNWFLGIYGIAKDELLKAKEKGERMTIRGYGLLLIPQNLDTLVLEVVDSINVRGKVRCSDTIQKHFGL